MDFSDLFNTQLSPEQEAVYQLWRQSLNPDQRSTRDYDLRGLFAGGNDLISPIIRNGHFPDTYKKPNHMTFSDQSKYSMGGTDGGQWMRFLNDSWQFTPSFTNLVMNNPNDLQQYFRQVEPGNTLNLP